MLINKRLILAHFWLAFAVFGLALALGAWQMFVRSPLNAWHFNPEFYYRSVTAHGSIMGYVLPTLVAMGFGYAISEAALEKPLIGRRWAWTGFWLVAAGAVVAMIPVSLMLGWLNSVVYVSALSLWALVSGHWSAWQAARVEVEQERQLAAEKRHPLEERVVNTVLEQTEINEASSPSK